MIFSVKGLFFAIKIGIISIALKLVIYCFNFLIFGGLGIITTVFLRIIGKNQWLHKNYL
jgi:hypothetical protein